MIMNQKVILNLQELENNGSRIHPKMLERIWNSLPEEIKALGRDIILYSSPAHGYVVRGPNFLKIFPLHIQFNTADILAMLGLSEEDFLSTYNRNLEIYDLNGNKVKGFESGEPEPLPPNGPEAA